MQACVEPGVQRSEVPPPWPPVVPPALCPAEGCDGLLPLSLPPEQASVAMVEKMARTADLARMSFSLRGGQEGSTLPLVSRILSGFTRGGGRQAAMCWVREAFVAGPFYFWFSMFRVSCLLQEEA